MKTLSYNSLMETTIKVIKDSNLEKELHDVVTIIQLKDGSIVEYNPEGECMDKFEDEFTWTQEFGTTLKDIEENKLDNRNEIHIRKLFESKGNNNIKNIYYMEI